MATWAAADLHGCLNAWEKMIAIIGPNDKVYVLGDCIDRGEDGWQIVKEIIDMPNVVYLRGKVRFMN